MPRRWRLLYSRAAQRSLDAMDPQVSRRLVKYLNERVLPLEDPRALGKALQGSKMGNYWRYRCGDYRIVVDIIDLDVVVVVMRVGDRKDVY